MQNATAVWARRGCCAVGVEDQGPAPSVHDDQVVERAQQAAVADRGFAAVSAGPQMMNVTADRRQVAAREPAMLIPAGDRPADLHRDGVGRGADIERQADAAGRAGKLAAQPGCQPARAGQQPHRLSDG